MTPGPKLIYRCPACQGLFSRRTLASGNTFGAKFRSDGWMQASMLPRTPPLVACPHCAQSFCMIGAEPEARYQDYAGSRIFWGEPTAEQLAEQQAHEALKARYADVPAYDEPTLGQCLEYLQTQDLQGREWPLRMYAWHRINDARLQTGRTALTQAEESNLLALLLRMHSAEEDVPLLRAEILRELRRFDEAAQALSGALPQEQIARAEQIMQAIERRDDQPFIFQSS